MASPLEGFGISFHCCLSKTGRCDIHSARDRLRREVSRVWIAFGENVPLRDTAHSLRVVASPGGRAVSYLTACAKFEIFSIQ